MALKHSYSMLAPVYDLIVERGSQTLRSDSISGFQKYMIQNDLLTTGNVLISGVGSGLDFPHLPAGPSYVGIDITPNMLKRAEPRIRPGQNVRLDVGDAMALPYEDATFDAIIMHLILAVVPRPERALLEAARTLKPGGHLFIVDKFLRPGQLAPLRRLLSPVMGQIATRTDVVFEQLLEQCPNLRLIKDEPALANGWFRRIVLKKQSQEPVGPGES